MRIKLRKPKVLEKSIEKPVTDFAKDNGVLVRKMNGLGFNAWPDRLFLYRGRVLFIEFKKPGEVATPAQAELHGDLRDQGFWVEVVDNVEEGKSRIRILLDGKAWMSPRRRA